jgi:hypothetical protein
MCFSPPLTGFKKRIPDLLHPVSFSFFSPGQPKLPLAVPFFRDRDTILASGFTITTGTAGGASPPHTKKEGSAAWRLFPALSYPNQLLRQDPSRQGLLAFPKGNHPQVKKPPAECREPFLSRKGCLPVCKLFLLYFVAAFTVMVLVALAP